MAKTNLPKMNVEALVGATLNEPDVVALLSERETPVQLLRAALVMAWDYAERAQFKNETLNSALMYGLRQPRARTADVAGRLAPGMMRYFFNEKNVPRWSNVVSSFPEAVASYFVRAPISGETLHEIAKRERRRWDVERMTILALALADRAGAQGRINAGGSWKIAEVAIRELEELYQDRRAETKSTSAASDFEDLSCSLMTMLPSVLGKLYPATSPLLVDLAIDVASMAGWRGRQIPGNRWDKLEAIGWHVELGENYCESRFERLMSARSLMLDRHMAATPWLSLAQLWSLYARYAKSDKPHLAGEILAHRDEIRVHILGTRSGMGAIGLALRARHIEDSPDRDPRVIAELALQGIRDNPDLVDRERRRKLAFFLYENLSETVTCGVLKKGKCDLALDLVEAWKKNATDGGRLEAILDSSDYRVRRELLGRRPAPFAEWTPYSGGSNITAFSGEKGRLYREKIMPTLVHDPCIEIQTLATSLFSQMKKHLSWYPPRPA